MGYKMYDVEVFHMVAQLRTENIFSIYTNLFVLSLCGGGKKKKKTFSKPLKNKHLHRRIKLRMSSYFEVSSNYVRSRLKHCPQCGPGTYMASHTNRMHCGSCKLTI